MDWPIIITVILVVGIGGLVVAKWWFRLSSRFHRYEDEQDPRTAHKNNQPDNEVVIHGTTLAHHHHTRTDKHRHR